MVQYDLIDALARDAGISNSRRKIKKSVAVIFDEIAEALVRGKRVELDGIGVLSTRTLGPRWGSDPATSRSVMLPETTYPVWHPDRKLTVRLQRFPETAVKASTGPGNGQRKKSGL